MDHDLPTGTVTFLFTDVEGSTRLLRELGAERYARALAEHRRVIREACATHEGTEVDTQGDGFFFAFPRAASAVAAARQLTDVLSEGHVRVRVGLHTGQPLLTAEGYIGEDVHLAARIAAAAHGGQVLASKKTASLVESELTELGEHRLHGFDEPVPIYQLGTSTFPALRAPTTTSLPQRASSFVGRDAELEAVRHLLQAGTRLVTLTGPGGSGKSRLAIEAAQLVAPSLTGGGAWIPLAAVRDPSLVIATIARGLGAKTSLEEHIGTRELLLVLDNFEQVVAAAPEVAALLRSCPNLAILVTSREILDVEGEREYSVPPLADQDAVALFCERAGLAPSAEIARVCACLDNLPLAIELAAARTRVLTPAQILDRLGQRLDLLKGGRDADPRQRTLRATVEWSEDLLNDDERGLFRCLSVFADGCTLEAADVVCEADLDTLQSLVEKSLLRFSGGRYTMLETIRAYAADRLVSPDRETAEARHRSYVVDLAAASAPDLHTREEAPVSARLAPEYANIRAAVASALAAGAPDDAATILGALYTFLISHGHLAEVGAWAEATLAQRSSLSPRGLAEALVAAGEFARFAGDLGRSKEHKEQLAGLDVDVFRPNVTAATLADLAEIALDEDDFAAARAYAEQSGRAGAAPRAALCLGELSLRLGDLSAAEAHGQTALSGFEHGAFNHACALELLGEAARRSGRVADAGDRFADALEAFAAIGDPGGMADSLEGLARLAAADGDAERAGRLAGVVDHLRTTRGRRPTRSDIPSVDAPQSAWVAGRSMTLDEALQYALEARPVRH